MGHLEPDPFTRPEAVTLIAALVPRSFAAVAGEVVDTRVSDRVAGPILTVDVRDSSGAIGLIFLGRRRIAGIDRGRRLTAAGMVGRHHGGLAMLNPYYWLEAGRRVR